MNAKNINILERALSSSDKVLMGEALKVSIAAKERELQANAEAHDYDAYLRNAGQFAKLSEALYTLQHA